MCNDAPRQTVLFFAIRLEQSEVQASAFVGPLRWGKSDPKRPCIGTFTMVFENHDSASVEVAEGACTDASE